MPSFFKKLLGSKPKETKGIGALLPMPSYGRVNPDLLFSQNGNHYGVDWTAALPQNVMQMIFEYVCPHTMDESYVCNEDSPTEEMGCMLCNMRDLSHCVLVCKRWRKFAVPVLYRSIRIDSVHYCALQDEIEAREARSNKSTYSGRDPGTLRTSLLSRTLKHDQLGLGTCILLLKLPYMVRESCKADLARIASVAPNLRYIDLPDGFFNGDASSQALRTELENRCMDIRKMTYNSGTEKAIESLTTGNLWPNLEVLSLSRLSLDPNTLRYVFGALQNLRELSVKDMPIFSDLLFDGIGDIPPFPPVTSLSIEGCPNITAQGLATYLSNPITSATLQSLSLTRTGVKPEDVHLILSAGSALQHFSIIEEISTPFPTQQNVPALKNRCLESLHYEITAQASATYTAGTAAYHAYLASSLLSNTLPSLRELYVRDNEFPTKLVSTPGGNGLTGDLAPPMPGFQFEPPSRPFAGRGTAGNRDSTASNFSSWGTPSSPPSKTGGFAPMPSSPENTRGRGNSGGQGQGGNRDSFIPTSFSPPKPGFANMSMHERRQSHLSMHQAQNAQARPRTAPQQGLKSPLVVYTKGLDEMEWNFSNVEPPRGHNRGGSVSGARPVSMIGVAGPGGGGRGSFSGGVSGAGAQSWIFGEELPAPPKMGAGGYRSSVILPNGFGGVIQREVEPGMEGSKTGNKLGKKGMKADLF